MKLLKNVLWILGSIAILIGAHRFGGDYLFMFITMAVVPLVWLKGASVERRRT